MCRDHLSPAEGAATTTMVDLHPSATQPEPEPEEMELWPRRCSYYPAVVPAATPAIPLLVRVTAMLQEQQKREDEEEMERFLSWTREQVSNGRNNFTSPNSSLSVTFLVRDPLYYYALMVSYLSIERAGGATVGVSPEHGEQESSPAPGTGRRRLTCCPISSHTPWTGC